LSALNFEEIMPMGDIKAKFLASGWECFTCDGHDTRALCEAYEAAAQVKGKPSIVLAKTVKGKGVSLMEGKNTWHGSPIGDASYETAMRELGGVE
jgi:transketolase